MIRGPNTFVRPPSITRKDIKELTWPQIRKKCRELGGPPFIEGREKLEKFLLRLAKVEEARYEREIQALTEGLRAPSGDSGSTEEAVAGADGQDIRSREE